MFINSTNCPFGTPPSQNAATFHISKPYDRSDRPMILFWKRQPSGPVVVDRRRCSAPPTLPSKHRSPVKYGSTADAVRRRAPRGRKTSCGRRHKNSSCIDLHFRYDATTPGQTGVVLDRWALPTPLSAFSTQRATVKTQVRFRLCKIGTPVATCGARRAGTPKERAPDLRSGARWRNLGGSTPPALPTPAPWWRSERATTPNGRSDQFSYTQLCAKWSRR